MTSHKTERLCTRLNIALAVVLVVSAGCAGSAATTAETGGGSGGSVALYAGSWQGTFDISLGSGGLSLFLNHEGDAWTGEVTFDAEGEIISGSIENFEITEEGCSFQTVVQGEADVYFKARLEEGALVGVLEAYAMSELVADGTFVLNKK